MLPRPRHQRSRQKAGAEDARSETIDGAGGLRITRTRCAEAVLEAVGGFSKLVTEVKILAAVGDDQQALIMYDNGHRPIRQTDTLVFDTHEVRKAQAATPRLPT